jgi:hypothetical protein
MCKKPGTPLTGGSVSAIVAEVSESACAGASLPDVVFCVFISCPRHKNTKIVFRTAAKSLQINEHSNTGVTRIKTVKISVFEHVPLHAITLPSFPRSAAAEISGLAKTQSLAQFRVAFVKDFVFPLASQGIGSYISRSFLLRVYATTEGN